MKFSLHECFSLKFGVPCISLVVIVMMTLVMILSLGCNNNQIFAASGVQLFDLSSYSLIEGLSQTVGMNMTDSSENMTLQNFDTRLSDLYNKSIKSVVSITTNIDPRLLEQQQQEDFILEESSPTFQPPLSSLPIDIPLGFGTGFIFDEDGRIITNYHVIEGGTSVDVRFHDGNSYSASLVGKDPLADLAVLQIDPAALSKQEIVPLNLGSSSNLRVGQTVVAIGSPLGLYSGTITEGIISQLNGIVPDPVKRVYNTNLIQIEVPITYGNSGGPLLNLNGEVVGVTSSGAIDPLHQTPLGFINFAIPSDKLERIVPELINNGSYAHAWLGTSSVDVTPYIAKIIGLSDAKGAIVYSVTPGSPAGVAGISAGSNDFQQTMVPDLLLGQVPIRLDADVIIGVDGRQINRAAELINYVDSKNIGDTITLKIIRNDVIHNVDLTLEERNF